MPFDDSPRSFLIFPINFTFILSGITLETDPSNPRHFVGVLIGPSDTPYSGGVYRVDITIPSDYPFGPPKMKFITKVHDHALRHPC